MTSPPLAVVLVGKIAGAGAERLRARFGERVAVEALSGGGGAVESGLLAAADVVVSDSWPVAQVSGGGSGGAAEDTARLRLLQVPISGLDRVDESRLPPRATLCNVYEHEIAIAEYVFCALLEWTVHLRAVIYTSPLPFAPRWREVVAAT